MKLLPIAIALLFLIGCNTNEKYTGKYYLYKIDTLIVKDTNVYFLLKADNTLTFYSDKDTIKGHWEVEEIKSDGYTAIRVNFNNFGFGSLLYGDDDSKESSFLVEYFYQSGTKSKYTNAKNVVFTRMPSKTQAQ